MTDFHPQAYEIKPLIAEWRRTHSILETNERPLNIVAIGAHPDDPETGCAGTLAQLATQGHNIHLLYATRGEAGKGAAPESIAAIRTKEAERACEVLHATPHFGGQIDGRTVADVIHTKSFTNQLLSLKPDIVFAQWWNDTHADHRNISKLAREAWKADNRKFTLVYYEVETGRETQNFRPNLYVNIDPALDIKREAIFAHQCQNPSRFFLRHVELEKQRGAESGVSRAEAFYVVQDASMRRDRHPAVMPIPRLVLQPVSVSRAVLQQSLQ